AITYTTGATVVLTATGTGNYVLTDWSGTLASEPAVSPLSVVMNSNVTTGSVFSDNTGGNTYAVLTITGGTNGTTAVDGVTLTPGTPYVFTYTTGQTAVLTAVPDPGCSFAGWLDDLTGTASPMNQIMSGNVLTRSSFTMDRGEPAMYTVTSSSDSGSTIDPEGNRSVPSMGSVTYTFSATPGNTISSVLVDGRPISSEEIALGTYTFRNVMSNHSIVVVTGEPVVLNITVSSGSGTAQYSINGTAFADYVSAVTLPHNALVTVRAVAEGGYEFRAWWNGDDIHSTEEVTFANVNSSLDLEVYFDDAPEGNIDGDNTLLLVIGGIVLVIAAASLVWFLFFYRAAYEVVKVVSSAAIIGKNRARRNKPYVFEIEGGPSGTVTYRTGENGNAKTLAPGPDGSYEIPKEDVIGKLTIEHR
ncbi:MAG: hypothetical protein LBR42_04285, partial [Candidatus Methanoplasma sp.]|nr:hypothetical protein [Candidatus Methanoplasma sp.]